MRVSASIKMIILSCISMQIKGLVLRPSRETVVKETMDQLDLAREYISEVQAQNRVIEEVENQLTLGGEQRSTERISELCNGLLDSYYRQMEPRNRMVEITPTDSVLDSTSIEYLVAVASRYATNVMHIARKLREGQLEQESLVEEIRNLRKEHSKTQMFDQILLELANVDLLAPTDADHVSKQNILQEEDAIQTQDDNRDGDAEVQVKVEQEIYTTTTETIVTSYTETSARPSW